MSRYVFLAAALGLAVACSSPPSLSGASQPDDTTQSAGDDESSVALLTLAHAKPAVVGAEVTASATGLPAGKTVDLRWGTVTGGWVIENYYHFRGKKYEETTTSLGQFPVDAGGRLEAKFTIPEDFGGVHDVVAMIDGMPAAQNGIEVTQSFDMSPRSGPVGTPIEIRVKGLGWRTMESTWVVNWDNTLLGFVSAASSKGSAVARIRATGPEGLHVVHLLTGYQGQGYLNHEQAPNSYLPRPQFTFQTTAGAPPPSQYAEPYQPQPVPDTKVEIQNATLSIAPTQGPVQTKAVLRGSGFPGGPRCGWSGRRTSETG